MAVRMAAAARSRTIKSVGKTRVMNSGETAIWMAAFGIRQTRKFKVSTETSMNPSIVNSNDLFDLNTSVFMTLILAKYTETVFNAKFAGGTSGARGCKSG